MSDRKNTNETTPKTLLNLLGCFTKKLSELDFTAKKPPCIYFHSIVYFHRTVKTYIMMKENELETQFIEQLPSLLPQDFAIAGVVRHSFAPAEDKFDFDIDARLKTPSGDFRIIIEVKNADRIAPLREAARRIKLSAKARNALPFVAGNFLGERARAVLKEEGVGFLDLAGNFFFKQNGLYVEKIVAKNPNSQKPPLKNLFAPVSSRITRALLIEPQRTWQISELARETEVSLGQAHSVAADMLAEEFLFLNTDKKLQLKDSTALLEAWKKVYPTYKQQRFSFFCYEQGQPKVLSLLLKEEGGKRFAFAFFTGAAFVAPFIRGLAKVQLYIENKEALGTWQKALALEPVEGGGNVELFIPYDKGVFYKQQTITTPELGDVPVVSNVQLYMDLFNNPARGQEQAEHLREMKLNY